MGFRFMFLAPLYMGKTNLAVTKYCVPCDYIANARFGFAWAVAVVIG